MLYIITGASQNHFKSLKQFLNSCPNNISIYVYDLGLSLDSIKELKLNYTNIIIEHFDYSKYPSYFNISVNAGEYAWKPAIIYEVMLKFKSNYTDTTILWCDSGNILCDDIININNIIKQNCIFSPISSGTIINWTHPKMLEWFNITNNSVLLNYSNRNGAILGFNLENDCVRELIEQFYNLACIKDCIAPDGSNRSNHRQDQALFTILYYSFFKNNNNFNIIDSYLGIRIHCDID